MSENMRIQSELSTDLEVYRLKGELLQLREQNRVLRQALRVAVFVDGPDTVQPEFERWSALVDEGLRQNFNEWYGVQVLVALTATSQPVKPAGKMHACDIPGCVSCGNPEDATSQEGQHG